MYIEAQRPAMNARLTPLLILALFAAAVFLLRANEQKYLADEGRLVVREDPARDAVILSWSSPVGAPMARRIEEAYRKYGNDTSIFVIDLNSPGGTVAEGKRVVQLLDRVARTHRVETRVGAGGDCLSMCVPIFLTGETRVAAANARFMFHEPASYDSFTGERANEPSFERRFAADRFFDRYFENSPMTPAWRAQLERDWVGREVWKTGEELWEENSGVLTALAP